MTVNKKNKNKRMSSEHAWQCNLPVKYSPNSCSSFMVLSYVNLACSSVILLFISLKYKSNLINNGIKRHSQVRKRGREKVNKRIYKSIRNIIQINLRPDHVKKYILMNEAQSSCNTHTKSQPCKPQKLWHLQR